MADSRPEISIGLTQTIFGRPILDGRVGAEGIRLRPSHVHSSELYWRQLQFGDFDVSDMSISSLLISTARGDTRYAAVPVFTSRRFFHTGILVRRAAGIGSPSDLRGKRVSVPEYQMTSAIWSRGILDHEFGVAPREIEWFMERNPDRSHGGATGFKPPPGVTVHQIPPETNIGEMMVAGQLDATLSYITDPNLVDRSTIDLLARPEFGHLFADRAAERRRYHAKTGLYPINHILIVRRSLLERYPWMALNLYNAFVEAKSVLVREAAEVLQPYLETGRVEGGPRALADDPMPYGLRAARREVETIARYVHEQGLTDRVVAPEEIFAPSTMEV